MKMAFFTRIMGWLRYGEQVHPSRDWGTLLILSFLVLVAGVVWNIGLFNKVSKGGTLSGEATSTPPVFSKDSLRAVEDVFSARAALEAQYAAGTKTFVDPSK